MQITLPDTTDVQSQTLAEGFARVDEYVVSLIERDKERIAVQEGLDAMREGRRRSFDEFDAEFREQNNIGRVSQRD